MQSIKESLRQKVELLSDEEARQILEFVQKLEGSKRDSRIQGRLANNAAITLPVNESTAFRVVQVIQGGGIPASHSW